MPIGATIADHISGQNLLAGILAALYARERTGRGQLVETSLLGGQLWAQAGEYTRYLLSGEVSGPSGRSHPMIPGIYGVFPTADGWIAIVGTAGPARDLFYRTIGRPDLIERFDPLLYFEDDKAELWPILDEVFATKPTGEWCELLGDAGLRFAPVRDHAEVAADPGVRANGYIARSRGPGRSRHRHGSSQGAGPLLGPRAGRAGPDPRAGSAHRRGPARGRVLLGRHRQPVGRGRDQTSPVPVIDGPEQRSGGETAAPWVGYVAAARARRAPSIRRWQIPAGINAVHIFGSPSTRRVRQRGVDCH